MLKIGAATPPFARPVRFGMPSRMGFDADKVRETARRLADRNIFIGTSSWKYEGWLGQLYSPERYEYRGRFAKRRFETGCLEEYAGTFRTVCVDAGFYQFPRFVEKLAAQVPPAFLFSLKVTDEITVKHFPRHARHGERAGKANTNFLNADLFVEAFLGPLQGIRPNIGVLMFEFGRFHGRDFSRGREFVEALDHFLGRIPAGWQYGVEIRNPGFLNPEYFGTLRKHGVAHVFNSWTAMPPVSEQMQMPEAFTTDFFAARFLLKPGRKYEEAVAAFSPYRDVGEEQPAERDAMRSLIARTPAKPSFVFVNNRLEGNALSTIAAVVAEANT